MIGPRHASLLFAAVVAALLAPSRPARGARGFDLGTGYEWLDPTDGAVAGPGFFDGPVTTLNPPNDAPPAAVPLPWPFPYQGADRSTVWISDNGWIAFADPGTDSAPAPGVLPAPAAPQLVVAPYWIDLDCSNAAFGFGIRHGRVDAAGAFRIQFFGAVVASGQLALADVYLYRDGRMKLQYGSALTLAATTVGIENASGTDGFAIVDRGARAPGVPESVGAGFVFDILPPPKLAEECGVVPATACGAIADSLPGALPENIVRYGCSREEHLARERVYAVTLPVAGRLRATLTPGTATDLRLYLLERCSERSCLRGPALSFDALLGPGTYHVAVDARAPANEGSFTLELECLPIGQPLACGGTVAGDTTGGESLSNLYPCAGSLDLSGPEARFLVDAPSAPLLRATLTAQSPGLDLLVFEVPAGGGSVEAADCLQRGDTSIVLRQPASGQYLVVVDGANGAAGPFTLETSCAVEADCGRVAGTIDFGTGVRQFVSGDTTTGASSVDVVACDLAGIHDGRELVYEVVLPRAGQVAIREPGGPSGHAFFLLDSCDESACAGKLAGSCGAVLEAGTHYLLADCAAGSEGPFALELVFDDVFNRWSACEEPNLSTSPGDTVRTVWEFNDGAYCISSPESHNHPDGCAFAMYATVRCGTEFHVPLYDVETGHLRVFDVFRGEYVSLDAVSTGGWTQSGTDISWEDCVGSSELWNNQTTDISFSRADGVCGVYRLEFANHSGFVWSLFANCTGESLGGYPIFDNLCDAVAAFEPLPDLVLASASATVSCPDITVTWEARNEGCAPARDVTVTLLDNGAAVATDTIPLVAPFSTGTSTFTTTFPGGASTGNVTLVMDAGDLVQECEETPDAGCAIQGGANSVRLVDCGPACDVVAVGAFSPSALCESGSASFDASASASTDCPGGVLEYRLTGPGASFPWQASPVFAGLSPSGTSDYLLEVRCADPSLRDGCVDSRTVTLGVERPPLLDGASIVAREVDCTPGIELSWSPATFRGATGSGVYNVYRSTVSCADAVGPAGRLVGTTPVAAFTDVATVAGETYYYVVEAEDATGFPGGCLPDGPTFGGAVTRADAPGGACAGIVERQGPDTALLPRVEGRLRVGWPEAYSPGTATLHWSTNEPLDAGADEHFHVLRSDRPDGGFSQLNVPDPPLLAATSFEDAAAARPGPGTTVLHYVVFVANACHADNRVEDR